MESNKREILKSKIKMHDMGKSMRSEPVAYKPREKHYPTLYLCGKQADFLKGMDVGDKCQIVCDVEIVSHSMRKSLTGEDTNDYSVEIKKIGKTK